MKFPKKDLTFEQYTHWYMHRTFDDRFSAFVSWVDETPIKEQEKQLGLSIRKIEHAKKTKPETLVYLWLHSRRLPTDKNDPKEARLRCEWNEWVLSEGDKKLAEERISNGITLTDSIRLEIQEEENAREPDGRKTDSKGKPLKCSQSLVEDVKTRDRHTCRACGFHYENEVVQAHLLDPLSERETPELTIWGNFVTLCPNCHYLAHHLLRQSPKYKNKDILLSKLKDLRESVYAN